MFAGIAGSASRVTSAHAGGLGIDDELTDESERILSGYASYTLGVNGENSSADDEQHPTTYFPRGSGACANNQSSNIKVNQNCLNLSDPDLQGRGQAQNEESIAVDPNDTNHVIGSYNDYRRGDGTCGVSYSLHNGRSWNDSTVPNGFVRGNNINLAPRDYLQASGTRRSPGTRKETPTCRARCSSADGRRQEIPSSQAASTSSVRPATMARPGTSPAGR